MDLDELRSALSLTLPVGITKVHELLCKAAPNQSCRRSVPQEKQSTMHSDGSPSPPYIAIDVVRKLC